MEARSLTYTYVGPNHVEHTIMKLKPLAELRREISLGTPVTAGMGSILSLSHLVTWAALNLKA